jgi:hypothetical protein
MFIKPLEISLSPERLVYPTITKFPHNDTFK